MLRARTIATIITASLLTLTACNAADDTVNTTPKKTAPKDAAHKDADSKDSDSEQADKPEEKKTAAIGDTLTVHGFSHNEQLDVTLKKWLPTAEPSNEYEVPQDGKRWAAAQFELVNTGSKVYSDSPSNGAQVADSKGQRFHSWFGDITAGPSMSSEVRLPKGEKALGWIVFEVPKNSKLVSIQFGMNSGFSDETGQWTVK
ncbi:DUF4352 domain-containing protein [Streptomyces cellostaticus]|uniref:DUF4352 domain-containing protein n=1 Tax=Streptomyces cellostaticus TaxID=67285 RepID=UPI002025F167|nr:DUF4352 domain-containing protein [Streptomyces cellostaticus]